MIDLDHGAVCVELDAIIASARDSVCASNHHLMGNSDAGAEPLLGADPRPNIVAGASSQNAHFCEGNMVSGNTCADAGQYADTTPSHTTASQLTGHPPFAHQQPNDTSNTSSSQQEKREGAAWRIAAHRYSTSASNDPAQHRPSRRAAANLNKVALKKTWHGTKSKQRRDRLSEAEKLSASVWSTFAANGSAVSLNLGISREAMLRTHADPKRRMTQNLSKHLSEAGLSHLPYAFVFELTPAREGGRLHLHGVIDTSGLTSAELGCLKVALVRAASVATGAIGGQRQLDLVPLHDPVGWTDYMLKDATRTARELGIDDPFMISKPMRRMAKTHFDLLRSEARSRAKTNIPLRSKPNVTLSTETKYSRNKFTIRSHCDRRRLSGERDKKSAGGLDRNAHHQPHLRKGYTSARPNKALRGITAADLLSRNRSRAGQAVF